MAGESSATHDVFFLDLSESGTTKGDSGLLLEALHERRIRTFIIENGELPPHRGDEITPALVTAIQASKIAIVVLTGGYGDVSLRRWNVLAYILDYFQGNSQNIIPIYYTGRSDAHTDPNSFDENFEKRKKGRVKTGNEEYKLWKVMAQINRLPGWDYNRDKKRKDQFNREIASQVFKMLNRAPLNVAVYPVGLKSRLEEVWLLLRLTSPKKKSLNMGFYGFEGIGKSTLARAVYNSIAHLFEVSCFLHNVRGNSNTHGLVGVQKMLLSNISGETHIPLENVTEGISMIKDRLHQKVTLLILDDVDSLDQLEALGRDPSWRLESGSRVIITTRDKHLLTFHGKDMLLYDVQALNDKDALELLSHRAFEHGSVDPRYREVLNRAIRYAHGLPLELDMIGSYCHGRSVAEWGNALARLEMIPYNDIERIQSALTYNGIQSIQGALTTSRSDPEASHISLSVPGSTQTQTESNAGVMSQMDFQKWMLILVFLVSCGVGLSCHALSSFKDEIKNQWWWPVFKKFPYVVVALAVLAVLATILRLNRYEIIRRLKCYIRYVIFLGITVYSDYYNSAVELGIRSAFSNGAFALTSLSLSKLLGLESEMGMFGYFLGCFSIQLMTIKWYLIFVAIFFGGPLFDWHSSSEPFLLTRIIRRIIRRFRAIPRRNLND